MFANLLDLPQSILVLGARAHAALNAPMIDEISGMMESGDWTCGECGVRLPGMMEVDHIGGHEPPGGSRARRPDVGGSPPVHGGVPARGDRTAGPCPRGFTLLRVLARRFRLRGDSPAPAGSPPGRVRGSSRRDHADRFPPHGTLPVQGSSRPDRAAPGEARPDRGGGRLPSNGGGGPFPPNRRSRTRGGGGPGGGRIAPICRICHDRRHLLWAGSRGRLTLMRAPDLSYAEISQLTWALAVHSGGDGFDIDRGKLSACLEARRRAAMGDIGHGNVEAVFEAVLTMADKMGEMWIRKRVSELDRRVRIVPTLLFEPDAPIKVWEASGFREVPDGWRERAVPPGFPGYETIGLAANAIEAPP